MLKRKLYLFYAIICIFVLFLASCDYNNSEVMDPDQPKEKVEEKPYLQQDKYTTLEEIPEEFSLQEAKDTGMLVLEGMDITSGWERWDQFLENVRSDVADNIMIAKYYELDNPSRYSAESYGEHKEDNSIMYLFLLQFNGITYTLSYYEGTQLLLYEYDYMIERIGQLSSNAAIADHFFALTNDSDLSYHEITWSMLSSQSTDWVDFKYVLNERVALDDYYSRQPGEYKTKDGVAWVKLDENCEFSFNRNSFTSYTPCGRYYVEGNSLILHVTDEEEYVFEIMGDGILKFVSGVYAENLIGIGTSFIYE